MSSAGRWTAKVRFLRSFDDLALRRHIDRGEQERAAIAQSTPFLRAGSVSGLGQRCSGLVHRKPGNKAWERFDDRGITPGMAVGCSPGLPASVLIRSASARRISMTARSGDVSLPFLVSPSMNLPNQRRPQQSKRCARNCNRQTGSCKQSAGSGKRGSAAMHRLKEWEEGWKDEKCGCDFGIFADDYRRSRG